MTDTWVVVLRTGDRPDDTYVYGPLDSKESAGRFADFLTTEVDPARAYPVDSPVGELLTFWNRQNKGAQRPAEWPPTPGQVWRDRDGNRWICCHTPNTIRTPYLVCVDKQADDSAEEIWRSHGPLVFVQTIFRNEGECPF